MKIFYVKLDKNKKEQLSRKELKALQSDTGYHIIEFVGKNIYNIKDTTVVEENSKPKFSVNKASSIGPSGGLCQTLYVYNALTNNSITIEGSLITATGTIVNDGSVGVIGAVDKKVYTIDIYMSKFFFVPEKDYDDAINAYNTIKDPKFDIVSVKNVRDAINFLVEFKEITEGGN